MKRTPWHITLAVLAASLRLFDQRTHYGIMDASPFKRDILQELKVACENEGIRLCFYHSIVDWHPQDGRLPIDASVKVQKAWLLVEPGEALDIKQSGVGDSIVLPEEVPDPIATVIKREMNYRE